MEVTAAASSTGSKTMADLIPRAAAEHAQSTAVRYKRDGAWHDVTYAQLAEIVQEIGLGLIDLGVKAGERVCILANTRPEWSYVDMAATSAGAVVVPIYPTNSPEECLWVISDSEAGTIVVENDEQLAKIEAIREQLPALRTIIMIEPSVARNADERLDGRPAIVAHGHARRGAQACSGATPHRSCRLAATRSAPMIRSPSSTPREPPGRRRDACSRTATTARSST